MTRALVIAVALVAGIAAPAVADPITVGLFAPSSPFPSTSARVELANKLGAHLGRALGTTATGRVYARGGDFAAAVKKGEVTIALVDAVYLASSSGYTVIAASQRGGQTAHGWQLVARGGAANVDALRGKTLLVPSVGGRETEFALNVMFGGELGREFFGRIDAAPDTGSALAALGLGKADAAIVPIGRDLPAGVSAVLTLPAIPGPLLVAYGTLAPAQRAALVAAATSFDGDATVSGLVPGDASAIRAVSGRFAIAPKRAPFALPAARLVVGDLVEGRTFTIERTPLTTFVIGAPAK